LTKTDPTSRADIIRQYLLQDSTILTRTLARLLNEKHPGYSVESWRGMVRVIRGAMGDQLRKQYNKETQFFRKPQDPAAVGKEYQLNPVTLRTEDFRLEHRNVLILSDIHLPYHDLDAVVIAVNYGIENECDAILLNGDVIDFYQLSRFTKSSTMATLLTERDMYFEFIRYLQDTTGLPIYHKLGNHEERYANYIRQQAPVLEQIPDLAIDKFLKMQESGVTMIEGRQKIKLGNLTVIHGHEGGESIFSPVNPARGAFLKYKANVLAGHNHQTSSHFESTLDGTLIGCWSTGCLCQLTPEYRPFAYTKWNHGFAHVEVNDDGSFTVNNKQIINNKIY
jgi:predicted phosphodiesterase